MIGKSKRSKSIILHRDKDDNDSSTSSNEPIQKITKTNNKNEKRKINTKQGYDVHLMAKEIMSRISNGQIVLHLKDIDHLNKVCAFIFTYIIYVCMYVCNNGHY